MADVFANLLLELMSTFSLEVLRRVWDVLLVDGIEADWSMKDVTFKSVANQGLVNDPFRGF